MQTRTVSRLQRLRCKRVFLDIDKPWPKGHQWASMWLPNLTENLIGLLPAVSACLRAHGFKHVYHSPDGKLIMRWLDISFMICESGSVYFNGVTTKHCIRLAAKAFCKAVVPQHKAILRI